MCYKYLTYFSGGLRNGGGGSIIGIDKKLCLCLDIGASITDIKEGKNTGVLICDPLANDIVV